MTALRKPVRRTTEARVPHHLTPRLVVTLSGDVIRLRKVRRRPGVHGRGGALYARLVAQRKK